jgi:hypothetical protein
MIQFPLDEVARSKEMVRSDEAAQADRDAADDGADRTTPKVAWFWKLFPKRRNAG